MNNLSLEKWSLTKTNKLTASQSGITTKVDLALSD